MLENAVHYFSEAPLTFRATYTSSLLAKDACKSCKKYTSHYRPLRFAELYCTIALIALHTYTRSKVIGSVVVVHKKSRD